MKTIQDNICVMIIRNAISVVAYHTHLSNHRTTKAQNYLALATLALCAIIIGTFCAICTSADEAAGHICNIAY